MLGGTRLDRDYIEPLEEMLENDNVMTQEIFDKALQCLVDNGIDVDEADIVLQALCYIILDEETKRFFSSDDFWELDDDGNWKLLQ